MFPKPNAKDGGIAVISKQSPMSMWRQAGAAAYLVKAMLAISRASRGGRHDAVPRPRQRRNGDRCKTDGSIIGSALGEGEWRRSTEDCATAGFRLNLP